MQRMRTRLLVVGLAALGGMVGVAKADQLIWSMENAGDGNLWKIDNSTNTATLIGAIKDPVLGDVGGGWSTVGETPDGTLYFLRRFQSDVNVYKVNSASIHVTAGVIDNLTSLGATGLSNNLDGLTAGPDGNLYLTAYQNSTAGHPVNGLYRFRLDTDTLEFVGTFGGDAGPGGLNSFYTDLAFDPITGDLIGTGTDSLGHFIPWRLHGSQVIGQINQTFTYVDAFAAWNGLSDGLAFDRVTGQLFASSDSGGVFEVDRTTGAILDSPNGLAHTGGTLIGSDLAVQADTIPNPTPEPAAIALLGTLVALTGVVARKRVKS